jgi:hypothetical protein
MKSTVVVARFSEPSLSRIWIGSPVLQRGRTFNRHVQIDFERAVVVDRREDRLRRDLVADPDRHVADDAVGWRRHREIAQLHHLLLHLRLQRLQIRFGGLQRGLRLLVLLFADGASREQFAGPLCLLPRERDSRLTRGELGFLARHRGLLSSRIDLHQRRTFAHAIARFHVNLRDLPVDLRLHRGRAQRLQRRHVLRRLVDGRHGRRLQRNRRRRHLRRRGWRALPLVTSR